MCGRFAVTTDPALLAARIDAINEIPADADVGPNYNVAPTDGVATLVSRHAEPDKPGGSARLDGGEAKLELPHRPGDQPTRRLRLMRWGLVPSWTKAGPNGAPASGGPLLINARADKVTTSPAFSASAERRRCLVPMDGYYEWRAAGPGTGRGARKTPFYIHGDGAMLYAAGLWSVWRPNRLSDAVLSVAIITTAAVGELAGIHDRMPLLLPEDHWDTWLDPDAGVDTKLLARPPEVAGIAVREVSTLVNSVRNNSPELIAPAEPQPEQAYLL
ncbi:SOS response-associated peptidase [[Mycobacterium] holstebronense]|uniref:Abasic site processing protein n=1 Tax=[Mycobacterium] holstebronense TaxID=3064288 RepID=A0ABN9NJI2_9MYCO|nr:SOS response-associated peptidase [Mycolicibacter sp. MU0102]CAJ1507520.1 SOS response-associated peptidase [Mycolicibacter sp. MU0102]